MRKIFLIIFMFDVALYGQDAAGHDEKKTILGDIGTENQSTSDHIITLGAMSTETTDNMSVVNIRFNETPPFKVIYIEDHGSFFQIKLPNTITPKTGEFIDGIGPYIEKIAAYQINPKESMIRLFLKEDAAIVKKYSDGEIIGNRIVVTIDHKALARALADQKIAENKSEANQLIGSQPAVENIDLQKPADAALPAQVATAPKAETDVKKPQTPDQHSQEEAQNGFNLQTALFNAGLFSLGMILLLLVTLGIKTAQRRKSAFRESGSDIPMKTLSHLMLSPKQKLALIQVGKEKLLLAIGPESVSLLTHYQQHPPQFPPLVKRPEALAPLRSEEKIIPQQQPKTLKPPLQKPRVSETARPPQAKKIEYAISDSGVKDLAQNSSAKTVDDVTRMIREKLKGLPKI